MRYLFVLGFTVLSSCITMPGDVRSFESKTDSVRHTSLEPAWLGDSWAIKLGLHKTSEMAVDKAHLIVAVSKDDTGTRLSKVYKPETISSKDAPATVSGVTVNVDGTKTALTAVDDVLERDNVGFARRRFEISMNLVKQMLKGKSVWVKVSQAGDNFAEGEFSKDKPQGAHRGFQNFLNAIEGGVEVRTPASK